MGLTILPKVIYTLGHSNRNIDEFLKLLREFNIQVLIDVRRFPSSKYEHFNKERLENILRKEGIKYIWFEKLGGYRERVLENSPNVAIKSQGFRNYADYMMSDEFKNQIKELELIAKKKRVALMCAERFFWKCHRRLISDFLVSRGWRVIHILDGRVYEHKLSPFARVLDENNIIYDVVSE